MTLEQKQARMRWRQSGKPREAPDIYDVDEKGAEGFEPRCWGAGLTFRDDEIYRNRGGYAPSWGLPNRNDL